MTQAKDPLRFFRLESREISEELGRAVLALEKSPDAAQVARLLRLAHTLKGASAVVKQRGIAEQAHALEDVLVPFRGRESAICRDDIERILSHTDAIAAQVAALGEAAPAPGRSTAAADEAGAMNAANREVDELLEMLSEAGVLTRAARGHSALVDQARQLSARLTEALAETRGMGKAQVLAGDLQSNLSRLEQSLRSGLDMAEREITQAHAAAERLRLSSCSAVLASVERAIRDTAAPLGKEVVFGSRGGETRLDAGVLALIQRALLQLARNAVAHGIETVEQRLAAGKPRHGQIEILVARRGNRVVFTCRDDGRGIDMEAVRHAAQLAGKLAPGAPAGGQGELLRLLFGGGVSTSGAVTELSGRGVGLDIVRETAARLGGEVSANTVASHGTEIELSVPASLSAMDALLVEACGAVCAVPLEAVRAGLQLSAGDVVHTPDGDCVAQGGEAVRFVPLARLLKRAVPPDARLAFLVAGPNGKAVIGVEKLLGVANILVRPLPELSFADPVIGGASVDAEGVPRLVLEPQALVAAALGVAGAAAAPAGGPPPPILVIDDSLTTRALEQSILESAGYEVDLATSAEEGLLKARQRRYGLFLVDVEMPGMDGFSFVSTIRADPQLRGIPAILVTSLNAPEHIARGSAVGAQAYVVKSEFNQVKVLETIRKCLEPA